MGYSAWRLRTVAHWSLGSRIRLVTPWFGISPTHTHRRIFVASRFTVGLCDISPCLPRYMLCLDVNEVNPRPDREVGHTRRVQAERVGEISDEMNRSGPRCEQR